jgi:hypothetical protein
MTTSGGKTFLAGKNWTAREKSINKARQEFSAAAEAAQLFVVSAFNRKLTG